MSTFERGLNIGIIVVYLGSMLAFGWWGKRRARTSSEFLVAGRRLGGPMYASTVAAMVIGGASTIGGVGLGYVYGISGMWLVVSIAVGVFLVSVLVAPTIQRIRILTVAEMLKLRYGVEATAVSGVVMAANTLMLTVTSTVAYSTIFNVVLGANKTVAAIIGGLVVVSYSAMGGMWSITLTDVVQIIIKTVAVFFLLLPFTWQRAGGLAGMRERLAASAFDFGAIGIGAIVSFFLLYSLGCLIGQDMWQRIFTGRSGKVARWGGVAASIYCLLYGVAGAVIGMASAVILPNIAASDDVYAKVTLEVLPVGLSGIVLAGAIAATMSTASAALIATSTVARRDVVPMIARMLRSTPSDHTIVDPESDLRGNRLYVIATGMISVVIAGLINDIVTALTIAYDLLVGGLLVPIVGGILWKRATGAGALAAMATGAAATLGTRYALHDMLASTPLLAGLLVAAVTFVIVSLATSQTPSQVMAKWTETTAAPKVVADRGDEDAVPAIM